MSAVYRRAVIGSRRGSTTSGLRIVTTGASWMMGERAVREGRPGSTIGGHFFAIPGSGAVANRGFYFTQDDGAGTQRGVDPQASTPALAGYTMTPIPLANGVLDRDAVATATEVVLSAIYATVTRHAGGIVEVNDNIDSAGAFRGGAWSERGSAGIWGQTRSDGGPSNFPQGDSIVCHAAGPVFSGVAYLRAMQIRIGSAFGDELRLGLYAGGSPGAPVGSTLIYDFGQLPAGTPTDEWATLWVPSDVVLPSAADLQFVVVATGVGTRVRYANAPAGPGNFTIGLTDVDDAIGNDPTQPLPAVFPAGGSSAGNIVFGVRLVYEETPLARRCGLVTRFGVHSDAPASSEAFNAQILVGGGLPPQIEHLRLAYQEVLAQGDASFRMGVLQGGAAELPGGSTLLWDGGRGPAGPGLPSGRYRIDAPTGIYVDRGQPIWWWGRGNGAQGPILFSAGLGGGTASPLTDPMDWPNNGAPTRPEYEAPATNPNHSTDPDSPFESPFVVGGSDFYPDNIPGAALGFAVDPIELIAI